MGYLIKDEHTGEYLTGYYSFVKDKQCARVFDAECDARDHIKHWLNASNKLLVTEKDTMGYLITSKLTGEYLFGNKTFTREKRSARVFNTESEAAPHINMWFNADSVVTIPAEEGPLVPIMDILKMAEDQIVKLYWGVNPSANYESPVRTENRAADNDDVVRTLRNVLREYKEKAVVTVNKATVLIDTPSTDDVILHLDLPTAIPAYEKQPTAKLEAVNGVEWVKANIGIDPEVVSMKHGKVK